ncbi:MAG: hypothetical protein ACFB5Z_20535 [Elainellaceae cyanobacterium]
MKRIALSIIAAGLTTLPLIVTPGVTSRALAQSVVGVNPAVDGENISPDASIYGQFEAAAGETVDPSSVRLQVNGEDVTTRSTITDSFFSYRPSQPFSPGAVTVRVEYSSAAGEMRAASWSFAVQPPQQAIAIESVTHNASSPIAPGDNFLATVTGTSGATASVLLVQDGLTVQVLPTEEVSPGVYVATLTVPTAQVDEGVVVGRLQQQSQQAYGVAEQPLQFSAAAGAAADPAVETSAEEATPAAEEATETTALAGLEFTSHEDGESVSGDRITLLGQTRPGAEVEVMVQTSRSVFGLVSLGETILDQSIAADEQGEFRVEVPLRGITAGSGTEYQVSASASLDGETFSETDLTLVRE